MIVSEPSSARGEEPVTGASSISTPRSPSAAPMRRASGGAIVDMSTASSPGRAASITPRSPSSSEATCAPSTTMLMTMSLSAATAAGSAAAGAPGSAAHRSALPAVCVQTVSGKPARATLAAMREPMIPRPRKPTRSGVAGSGISESFPTGGLDAQPLPLCERARALAGQRRAVEQIATRCAGLSAGGAAGGVAAALGDQREGHLAQRLQLAHDAVAAAVRTRSAGAAPQGVLQDAQREFALERLDRRVERVAHRHIHSRGSVAIRACALPAAERLVVGEGLIAEREVVHRALPLRAADGAEQIGRG